jgi:hypothetical protein
MSYAAMFRVGYCYWHILSASDGILLLTYNRKKTVNNLPLLWPGLADLSEPADRISGTTVPA